MVEDQRLVVAASLSKFVLSVALIDRSIEAHKQSGFWHASVIFEKNALNDVHHDLVCALQNLMNS